MMKRLLICTGALLSIVLSFGNAQAQTKPNTTQDSSAITPQGNKGAATTTPVVGSGTPGQLTKWLGSDSSSYTLGNSVITENKFGLIGIGTTAPTSKLTILGSSSLPIVTTINTFAGGTGLSARGGSTTGDFGGPGGDGVTAIGGNSSSLDFGFGGRGVSARGGDSTDGDAQAPGGDGVFAQGGNSASFDGGFGVHAIGGSGGSHQGGTGVFGQGGPGTFGRGGAGVVGLGGNANLAGIGVFALGGNSEGTGPFDSGGDAIFALGGQGNSPGYAGKFWGSVQVLGTLSKSAGSFKIDHPLDPENKYLYHSFVESPDMMNIYNGNVTTDANGDAVITLPDWFEALNKDFRYQLTVIGTFAQAIVASEMKDNHFVIKTNAGNVKVSWQVTGVRQDAYAKAHRINVEEDKPEKERGYYLHPDLFNQPEEKGIEWASHPELMKEMKVKREQTKQQSQSHSQPNQ